MAALNCLLECIRKYDPRHLEPHFKDIWNSSKQVRYRLNLTTQKVLSCRLRVYGCGIHSTQPKFFSCNLVNSSGNNGNPRHPPESRCSLRLSLHPRRRHRRPRVGRAVAGQFGRRVRVGGHDLGRPEVLPQVSAARFLEFSYLVIVY